MSPRSDLPSPSGIRLTPREILISLVTALTVVTLVHLTPPTLFEGTDWQQLHLPARQYMTAALAKGRLPLWNPHIALGRPFLADIETAVFYPPNLSYLVLEPALAAALLTAAHAMLAMIGVLLLGRRLGMTPWVCWLCATLFTSSEALVARVQSGQAHYAEGITYLPLLLLLAARLADAFSWARVLGLAVGLALQLLCGHPQIAWLSWLALASFQLGCIEPGRLRHSARGLLALGLALAAALALAGPIVLPFLELVTEGNRTAHTIEYSGDQGMGIFSWSSLAVPDGGRRAFYWEFNLYTGISVLIGGVGGLVATWRKRETRGLMGLALVGILLASGNETPAFRFFFELVPGTSLFRLHARAALLVVIALVLGLGLLVSHPRLRTRKIVGALAAGAAVAALLTAGYYRSAPAGLSALAPLPRMAWLVASATTLAAVSLARSDGRRKLAGVAVTTLALTDIGASIPGAKRGWLMEVASGGEAPLRQFLLQYGLYDPTGTPPRVCVPPELVRENAGVIYGWSNVAGYEAVSLARVWVFLHESLGLAAPTEATFPSHGIYSHGPFPYDSMNLVAGVEPNTWRLAGRYVADPRAYLASGAVRVAHWREAVSMMKAGQDFHHVALLESPPPAGLGESPRIGAAGSARIVSFAPERIELATESDGPVLLVVAEPWYPGWQATVDGVPTPCVPANAWMRAVPVPAGRHRVRMQFHSTWLVPGLALSALSLAALGILVWREKSTPRTTTPA